VCKEGSVGVAGKDQLRVREGSVGGAGKDQLGVQGRISCRCREG
jgi:hypothetical protein